MANEKTDKTPHKADSDGGQSFLSALLAGVAKMLVGRLTLPAINLRFSAPLSGGRDWHGVKTYEVHPPTKTVKLDKDGMVNKDGSETSVTVDAKDRYVILLHFARYADAESRDNTAVRSTRDVIMDVLHGAIRATAHNGNGRKGNINGTSKAAQDAYKAATFTEDVTKDAATNRVTSRQWLPSAGLVAEVETLAKQLGPIPDDVLLDVTGFPRMQGAAMVAAKCITEGCKVTLRGTIAQVREAQIVLNATCALHGSPISWDEEVQAMIDAANRRNAKKGRPAKAGKADAKAAA